MLQVQAVRAAVPRILPLWAYSDDVKQLCIKMYLNGMGLRRIERVTEIHHTPVMH
jgi:transposase-like protein